MKNTEWTTCWRSAQARAYHLDQCWPSAFPLFDVLHASTYN